MESVYEQLTQAIAAMAEEPTNEKLFAVLQQLGDMMESGSSVLVPADKLQEQSSGEEERIQFRMLQGGDGSALLVCFTSQEELARGAATTAVELPLPQLVETALSNEQIGGIVINPWGKAFRLNRQLLEMLQEMGAQSEGQLCTADHVPDEFIVALREAGVLLTDIRMIAIAGLVRQQEGSFLLLVECEPEADQQQVFQRLSAHLKPTVLPVDVAPLEGELPECARVIYRKL